MNLTNLYFVSKLLIISTFKFSNVLPFIFVLPFIITMIMTVITVLLVEKNFNFYLFVYSWAGSLLPCGLLSRCGELGPPLTAVLGFSLVVEDELWGPRAQ